MNCPQLWPLFLATALLHAEGVASTLPNNSRADQCVQVRVLTDKGRIALVLREPLARIFLKDENPRTYRLSGSPLKTGYRFALPTGLNPQNFELIGITPEGKTFQCPFEFAPLLRTKILFYS